MFTEFTFPNFLSMSNSFFKLPPTGMLQFIVMEVISSPALCL
jgi:hypothetical protein